VWGYAAAGVDHVLGVATVVGSAAIGAVVMAAAVVFLVLGARLGYPDVVSADDAPPRRVPTGA
jgi:hypothetical protein